MESDIFTEFNDGTWTEDVRKRFGRSETTTRHNGIKGMRHKEKHESKKEN